MPYKFYILDGTGTTRQKHTFSSTATEKPNAGQHLNFPLLAFQGLAIWPFGHFETQFWRRATKRGIQGSTCGYGLL